VSRHTKTMTALLSIPAKRGEHSREIDAISQYGLDDGVIARQAG